MQIITDERGFVRSFAFVGNLVGATEIPEPEDLDLFMHQFYAFQLVDGALIHSTAEYDAVLLEDQKDKLRKCRETECFSIINRGQLWYEGVSITQLLELRKWYKAWLDVTETMVVPEKPSWLT